ncbi:MAG: CRTAC1 family protein, partial [Bryobacteraceae bacterium]
YKLPDTVFLNRADGTFADVSSASGPEFAAPRAHRGSVVADFDGDGKLDVVVSVLGGKPEFWRNTSTGSDHWLDLKLIGSRSNRDGIGAVVHLDKQWNHQSSSVGYASSVLAPVHFGLGAQAVVPTIEIDWPSGVRQELHNVKADRVLEVREPAGNR